MLPSVNFVKLGLRENRTTFEPGEEIAGAANWELAESPKSVAVRLCWYTSGQGTQDVEMVEEITFDAPQRGDTRAFRFTAPAEPYSFSGKLISLQWAVELILAPGDHHQRQEVVIGPDGREVILPAPLTREPLRLRSRAKRE